jgi:glycosyltransferase involved in cell wall biosynthesis
VATPRSVTIDMIQTMTSNSVATNFGAAAPAARGDGASEQAAAAERAASTRPAPRLSIGLPVYNGQLFLDQCIESLQAQTFRDFELIICDNASTDDTPRIAAEWAQRDPRISVHRAAENRGAAANFNWAFELSRGELFKWCAVDDLMEPTFLQECMKALERYPDATLAYTGTLDIDETGAVLGEIYDNRANLQFGSTRADIRFRDLICNVHSCIPVFGIIRRDALLHSTLIAPYVASDKVLLAQLGLRGKFVKLEENLLLHRQHRKRSVTENPSLQARAAWFNSRAKGKVYPHFRLGREYLLSALTAPLSLADKLRCMIQLLRWFHWDGRQGMLDDLRYYRRKAARDAGK